MNADLLELVGFHLTGDRSGGDLDEIAELNLHPALFTGYRDLTRLRYDYPLVLAEGAADGAFVRSLSGLVDEILQEIAPQGIEGQRLRKHVLALENEIRALVSRGAKGSLAELWDLAENDLLSGSVEAEGELLRDSLSRARGVLRLDGEVIDCNEETPVKLLTHAWTAVQGNKVQGFRDQVGELVLKLSEILKADFMKSDQARTPEKLQHSLGTGYEAAFDFEAMSRILTKARPKDSLPEKRRRRIRAALSVLQLQRFFAPAHESGAQRGREQPHCFAFDSCTRALQAFQERLPEMVALVKAVSIAELEIENRYRESKHDPFFNRFDASSLVPRDLEWFPSYLVCLRDGRYDGREEAKLIEILSSELPLKVLVQTDDILGQSSVGAGQFSFGAKSLQRASMAVGLGGAYVLQSSSSNLYQLTDQLLRGLRSQGPALFSIFSGAVRDAADFPPYLTAASAMQSRAFPAFTYDPGAGRDWASRFFIGDNPQAGLDWPVESFRYEDEHLQRVSEDVAFTFVDFVASDKRYAKHFAHVPRSRWHEGMIPVREFLELGVEGTPEAVPYVLMVDENDVLQKVIVEDKLIHGARRCGEMWRSLQELGGIDNSHARRLLEREREVWEREKERELEELRRRPEQEAGVPAPEEGAGAQEAAAAEEAPEGQVEEAREAPSDEPYIETPRCTTCDECIEINSRMFAYDDNKQAYIADPDAGTYRQVVEAAEVCQVCIVHPGKPRNPDEPNLDELIKRAEPFM